MPLAVLVNSNGAKDGDLVAGEAVMCSEAAALPSCGMRHVRIGKSASFVRLRACRSATTRLSSAARASAAARSSFLLDVADSCMVQVRRYSVATSSL